MAVVVVALDGGIGINTAMISGAQILYFAVSSNTTLFAIGEFIALDRVRRAHFWNCCADDPVAAPLSDHNRCGRPRRAD